MNKQVYVPILKFKFVQHAPQEKMLYNRIFIPKVLVDGDAIAISWPYKSWTC